MATFVMSVTDTDHVGNRHSVCRHPPAEIGPTVGLRESAKMNPTKCMRIVTYHWEKGINCLLC